MENSWSLVIGGRLLKRFKSMQQLNPISMVRWANCRKEPLKILKLRLQNVS